MSITAHALERCRQRGIPEYVLGIIKDIGVKEKRSYGATLSTICKKDLDKMIHELKSMVQQVDKLKKVSVIVAEDNETIITTYRKTE
ncbi:MAG: hypothetical protein Q8P28_10600 [Deltaproteobacteria bacterium]|nr:hypothetical protein [Deltaproteobacteria bacterium]